MAITIRIKNRDIETSFAYGPDPACVAIGRCLKIHPRLLAFDGNRVFVLTEGGKTLCSLIMNKDDLELVELVRSEWKTNRDWFKVETYDPIHFYLVSEDKDGT